MSRGLLLEKGLDDRYHDPTAHGGRWFASPPLLAPCVRSWRAGLGEYLLRIADTNAFGPVSPEQFETVH